MGWVELLKTHSITHTSLGYCGLVWVQPTPFRRVTRRRSRKMSKVKRIMSLRSKSETNHLIIEEIKMIMMKTKIKTKRNVSTATVLITQQKIADTFIQKRQMINFESNISSKNRVK
jgi:hypothetical protein